MKSSSRCVVITGVSSGIGKSISLFLDRQHVRVFGCGRSKIHLPCSIEYSRLDIGNASEVRHWAAEVSQKSPRIDMLINNAAELGVRESFQNVPLKVWRQTLSTNIMGTINVTRAFLNQIQSSSPSSIVNISSIMGRFGRAGWSTYCVSKFAIEGLTECLAQETAQYGVNVISLMPSRVSTKLRRQAYAREKLCQTNIKPVLSCIIWILNNPETQLSGKSLSSDDLAHWSMTGKAI
jgi:NAD(P)-dependent dehydrogenase (short-subunit alcohol dehydrogenase family)